MKKISFLARLKQQRKIQIVESSEEICSAYIGKSEKSLRSAKVTFEIESYEDSVSLSYYSMYYMVLALFFKAGIKCENHTAATILLKEVFNIDNTSVQKAKTERVDKQYYVDFSVTKEEVGQMIRLAEKFNSEIFAFIDSLNQGKISEYQMKAKSLISSS